jgi:hypothetical protein
MDNTENFVIYEETELEKKYTELEKKYNDLDKYHQEILKKYNETLKKNLELEKKIESDENSHVNYVIKSEENPYINYLIEKKVIESKDNLNNDENLLINPIDPKDKNGFNFTNLKKYIKNAIRL